MTKQDAYKGRRAIIEAAAASTPLEHLAATLAAMTAANAIRATPEHISIRTLSRRRVKPPARRGTIDTRVIRKAVAMARARRLWGAR